MTQDDARREAETQVLLTWGVRPGGEVSEADVERYLGTAVAGLLSYVDRVSRERTRQARQEDAESELLVRSARDAAEAEAIAADTIANRLREALSGTAHALKVISGGGWDLKDKAQAVRLMQLVASNALQDVRQLVPSDGESVASEEK